MFAADHRIIAETGAGCTQNGSAPVAKPLSGRFSDGSVLWNGNNGSSVEPVIFQDTLIEGASCKMNSADAAREIFHRSRQVVILQEARRIPKA